MMKKLLSLLLILSLAGALCACGGKTTTSSSVSATAARVTQPDRLAQIVARHRFEGVVTVMRGGTKLGESATGIADPQTGRQTTIDSLFCVGSLSKQFCAAAVLLLQERGMLSVDDTLGAYFPDCPYGDRVTLRQMLNMCSGIAEFYETVPDGHNINELPIGTLRDTVTNDGTKEDNRDLLQQWLFEQPLGFEPGSAVVYTNSNYFLLARMVEQVSGTPYEDFLRENIFRPLGMTSTGFIDDMLDDPRLAKNAREAQTVYVGITMGLGDLVTDAADMERWLGSFFDNRLLSSESVAMMTDPGAGGYGFGVVPAGSGSWYHTGIFTSYSAFDYVDPQKKAFAFAVTNNQSTMPYGVADMCYELLAEA